MSDSAGTSCNQGMLPSGILEQFLASELGWKGEALSSDEMAKALRALAGRLDSAVVSDPGGRSRALLIQCASETHSALLDVTEVHHRAYAERWGIDFVCRRGRQQAERSPYWDRLHLLLMALRQGQHDFIVVLEADCLVRAVEWDIRGGLPHDAWLGMTAYPTGTGRYPRSTAPYLHTGTMLVRHTPEALAFFEEVWREGQGVDDDNTAILRLLQQAPERWRGGIVVLPESLNALADSPAARDAAIVAWHGMGTPPERAAAMGAVLGQGGSSREQRPLWVPSNRMPADPVIGVNFKALLGRPLSVVGELPALLYEKVGRAAPDIRRAASAGTKARGGQSVDIQALSGSGESLDRMTGQGRRLLIYPWSRFLQEGMTDSFDWAEEIWAASRLERDIYVHRGVPAEKVQVVVQGVDTSHFSPVGPKLTLPISRKRRLLLMGPLTQDAGSDIALAAYRRAFTRSDDVCLVVSSPGESPLQELFYAAESDGSCPEILMLGDVLDAAGRASLYRSCHALLAPARRTPDPQLLWEAMASGLPVIAGAGLALDDVADDTSSFRVPARWQREGEAYFQEADLAMLAEAMQSAVSQPALTERFGEAARAQVESYATLSHWRERMRERLSRLVEPPLSSAAPAQPWSEPEGGGEEAAPPVRSGRGRKKAQTPPSAPILSLCMIARDEEARLGACLASIKPFVDEMIVVDTGSTDRTKEIAREQGARVFTFPWVNSFAEARNQSLAQARGKWIFWMDADDVIPEACGRQLKELVARHPERDAAYQVQVRIPPGEGEYAETVVDHVKLFPNSPDIRFEFRIHEQVLPSLRRKGIDVLPSDLFVVHAHYDRSTGGQQKKRLRDFGLLERDLQEHPDHPFVLFNLGMTHLFATKEFEVAAQYLERCLARSHPRDSIVSKAYALLTTCRVCQRRWRAARGVCDAGLSHYPDDAELLYRGGQIYHELGEPNVARLLLEKLVGGSDSPGVASSVRNGVTGFSNVLGMFELAQANLSLGCSDRAAALLRRTLRDYPDFVPAGDLLRRVTGEEKGPDRQSWPERPRVAVYYHAYLQGDWEALVREQLERLKGCGLLARADMLVAGVIGEEASLRRFKKLLPRGGVKWETLGMGEHDAKAEYKTLKRLHEDGLAGHYEAAWYFHTKGIWRQAPGSASWRRYMEYFLLDRWEAGLEALSSGWDTYGVEWRDPTPEAPWRHHVGNFWCARADYLRCLSPLVFQSRHSCEDWIGHANARAFCAHRSGVNLYEQVYPEDSYRLPTK